MCDLNIIRIFTECELVQLFDGLTIHYRKPDISQFLAWADVPPLEAPTHPLPVNTICSPEEWTLGFHAHKHVCPNCGTCWKHSDDVSGTAISEMAHMCPVCGTTQLARHWNAAERSEINKM